MYWNNFLHFSHLLELISNILWSEHKAISVENIALFARQVLLVPIGIDSPRPLGRVGFDDERHKTTFCVLVQQFDSKTAGIRLRE